MKEEKVVWRGVKVSVASFFDQGYQTTKEERDKNRQN